MKIFRSTNMLAVTLGIYTEKGGFSSLIDYIEHTLIFDFRLLKKKNKKKSTPQLNQCFATSF